jgi:hypothetical protein
MLAAAVVLLGSVDSAAVVEAVEAVLLALQVAEGRARLAHKLRPLVVLQVAGLAPVPPEPVLLLHLLPLRLPQVVVESEVTLHLKGRRSCSAAMAGSSPPTVQPTYERALSTR